MGKHDSPRANMIRNKIVQLGPGHNGGDDQPRQLSDSPDNNNTGESTPKNYAFPSLAKTTGPSTYDEKKMQKSGECVLQNIFFLVTAHLIAGHCLSTGHHTVTTEPSTEELNLRPEAVRTPDKSAHKVKRRNGKLLNSGRSLRPNHHLNPSLSRPNINNPFRTPFEQVKRSFSPENGMGNIAKPDTLLDSQPNHHLKPSLSSGGRQTFNQDPAPLDIDPYHFQTPFEQEGEYSEANGQGQGVINNITKMAVVIFNFVIRIAKKLFYEAILQLSIGYLLTLITDWKKHLHVRLGSYGK